jgi:lysophospholipase L1-like esterase
MIIRRLRGIGPRARRIAALARCERAIAFICQRRDLRVPAMHRFRKAVQQQHQRRAGLADGEDIEGQAGRNRDLFELGHGSNSGSNPYAADHGLLTAKMPERLCAARSIRRPPLSIARFDRRSKEAGRASGTTQRSKISGGWNDILTFGRVPSVNPILSVRLSAYMNRMRIGFAVLLIGAVAVGVSFARKAAMSEPHRRARQLILYYTLSRLDNPIIILGDSIVEASTLPRELCGHAIVNAGLNGASTTSDLGPWLLDVLDGKPAAAIVVSLGTNDALGAARSRPQFEANYSALLAQLSKATTHVIALAIPSIDVLHRVKSEMQTEAMVLINDYNSALPELAAKGGATFAALPAMPTPHTIDGVHLSAAGYQVWNQAVLQGASSLCGSK